MSSHFEKNHWFTPTTFSYRDTKVKKISTSASRRTDGTEEGRTWIVLERSRGFHGSLVDSRRKLTLSLRWKPRSWPARVILKKLPGGFCEPGAGSSINSCLQRSSRLPANFNGPLTHGYRHFLMPRDVHCSSSSALHLHSHATHAISSSLALSCPMNRCFNSVSSGSWDPATWRI